MHQYWLINCCKCTTLKHDVKKQGNCVRRGKKVYQGTAPSIQFFYKPETALKIFQLKKNPADDNSNTMKLNYFIHIPNCLVLSFP